MSHITILKGKLLKGDYVSIEYQKRDSSDASPANCSFEQDAAPRKEFKKAFAALAIHAALLSELIPISAVKKIDKYDEDLVKDFTVTGFSVHITKSTEDGVIITAHKTLKNGKSLGFNTPLLRYNDEGENVYPFAKELEIAIATCQDELIEYLNGVRAEDPQLKMEMQ